MEKNGDGNSVQKLTVVHVLLGVDMCPIQREEGWLSHLQGQKRKIGPWGSFGHPQGPNPLTFSFSFSFFSLSLSFEPSPRAKPIYFIIYFFFLFCPWEWPNHSHGPWGWFGHPQGSNPLNFIFLALLPLRVAEPFPNGLKGWLLLFLFLFFHFFF